MTQNQFKIGEHVRINVDGQTYESDTLIYYDHHHYDDERSIISMTQEDRLNLEKYFNIFFQDVPIISLINGKSYSFCLFLNTCLSSIEKDTKEDNVSKSNNQSIDYLKIYNKYRKIIYQNPLKPDDWSEEDLRIECERLNLL